MQHSSDPAKACCIVPNGANVRQLVFRPIALLLKFRACEELEYPRQPSIADKLPRSAVDVCFAGRLRSTSTNRTGVGAGLSRRGVGKLSSRIDMLLRRFVPRFRRKLKAHCFLNFSSNLSRHKASVHVLFCRRNINYHLLCIKVNFDHQRP